MVCCGTACTVEIHPREIGFVLPEGQQPVDGVPLALPLELVQGINSCAAVGNAVSCVISIAGDQPLELRFKPANVFAAAQKQHLKACDSFVCELEAALAVAREACTAAAPTTAPTANAPPAATTTTTPAAATAAPTARVKKGQQLRELLRCVSKLHSKHKTKEAEQLLASAAPGSSSAALAKKRAQQLRGDLFTFGGLELTRQVLHSFLNMSEVKLLLPEKVKKARKEAADAKTARVLLETASEFLHSVLASKGRRSDDDRNAFWASVVSLIPRDAARKRMVRGAMRLLKVPKRIVKQAMVMRSELEDRAKGWRRITSNGHRDKVDGSIIAEAWHRCACPAALVPYHAMPCPPALPSCPALGFGGI